jgi:nitrate/TMAO reductase-like tetraheme cytochrome c subunit
MSLTTFSVIGLGMAAIAVILVVVHRAEAGRSRYTWTLGLLGFIGLPGLVLMLGFSRQMEQAGTTEFCLSCHEMRPYGMSLQIDDESLLPATHFQNKRIPRDRACYSCHTSYTMFGGVNDKMRGARHVWKHFFDSSEDDARLHLYTPFQNRECLHCHAGARSFEESFGHEDIIEDLTNEVFSCLDCHDTTHAMDSIEGHELWNLEAPEWTGFV